jgi:hypothetical protein
VLANCYFGAPVRANGDPLVADTARVPGGVGSTSGRLIHDRNNDGRYDGDGVANTKVVLVDQEIGRVAARSVTDALGNFAFRDVPANRYAFRVVGPWKLVGDVYLVLQIVHGQSVDGHQVMVIPGAIQPDPDAPPVRTDPAPQGGVVAGGSARLATTGAAVIELSIVGIVVFAMGLAMVLVFARRRRCA